MGFIGIRAIKKNQQWNKSQNSCPPHVKKKSEKQDSIFSLFMKSIHTVVNVLKELNDFDGVLAHILACLHPVELLQATLDLPQL